MSMKVLIADPDWYFLRQARDYLESRGDYVAHENSADPALRRAAHWRPDLIMVSAELPECCDGDLLSAFDKLQPRPAIILTAALERFDKAWRAWQRGGDEVIIKPVLHTSEFHVAVVAALKNSVCPRRPELPGEVIAKSA